MFNKKIIAALSVLYLVSLFGCHSAPKNQLANKPSVDKKPENQNSISESTQPTNSDSTTVNSKEKNTLTNNPSLKPDSSAQAEIDYEKILQQKIDKFKEPTNHDVDRRFYYFPSPIFMKESGVDGGEKKIEFGVGFADFEKTSETYDERDANLKRDRKNDAIVKGFRRFLNANPSLSQLVKDYGIKRDDARSILINSELNVYNKESMEIDPIWLKKQSTLRLYSMFGTDVEIAKLRWEVLARDEVLEMKIKDILINCIDKLPQRIIGQDVVDIMKKTILDEVNRELVRMREQLKAELKEELKAEMAKTATNKKGN